MGFSLSLLAVKGLPPQEIHRELGLEATGEREEFAESPITGAELPAGWYLVVCQKSDEVVPAAEMGRLSSLGAELVASFAEEHVMCSGASNWKDGRMIWSVSHDAQKRRDHLATEGALPPAFESILADLQKEQREADAAKDEVDYIFEVPVSLAESVVGYRYDSDIEGASGQPFEVLIRNRKAPSAGSPKRPFWQRLFSR